MMEQLIKSNSCDHDWGRVFRHPDWHYRSGRDAVEGGRVLINSSTRLRGFGFDAADCPSVIAYVKAGKLWALAVTGAHRSPSEPDLPTISEAGVPGYEAGTWYGLLVPAGTPKEIVAQLHAQAVKTLTLADVKERLKAIGYEAIGSTPEEYAAYTRAETEKWARVVKTSGVHAD